MNVLGLFSGIGGFELGFQRAGFNIVAMCEIEPYARGVLSRHWPGVPIFDDVRTLTGEQLRPFKIDVITGGFPCQDISLAGKGAGITGARSGLWVEMFRIIGEVRPAWVVIENVSALRSRGLEDVLGALAAIGYDAEWHCIPASAVGAPHRRDRVWIVAYPAWVLEGRQEQRAVGERAWAGGQSQPAPDPYGDELWEQPRRGCGADGACAPFPSDDGGQGAVAYAIGPGLEGRPNISRHSAGELSAIERSGSVLHADGAGPFPSALAGLYRGEEGAGAWDGEPQRPDWWFVEPNVGRVAHGIPRRVDRLKGLGNAVVPQIPEMIARAIRDPFAT